jgi:hypothetical protein
MKKLIVDCSTGKENYVNLTVEEIKQIEVELEAAAKIKADQEASEAAKQADKETIAAKLGLTAEELVKLLG